ncbi:MAG: DJ-1/PfpI family protein [Acidimicrobiia bacterium]
MELAILLYDGVTALDAIGPYEVLSRLPEADVKFVATTPGVKFTGQGSCGIVAEHALSDVPHPDVLIIPGGPGERAIRNDAVAIDWIREAHAHAQWTVSVCTGALILGAAGILEGVPATTHWLAREELRAMGADVVDERVCVEDNIITAAGVSAGIDMALTLAGLLEGELIAQGIQLSIEYDPQPPYPAGSPDTTTPVVVELVRSNSRFPRS